MEKYEWQVVKNWLLTCGLLWQLHFARSEVNGSVVFYDWMGKVGSYHFFFWLCNFISMVMFMALEPLLVITVTHMFDSGCVPKMKLYILSQFYSPPGLPRESTKSIFLFGTHYVNCVKKIEITGMNTLPLTPWGYILSYSRPPIKEMKLVMSKMFLY